MAGIIFRRLRRCPWERRGGDLRYSGAAERDTVVIIGSGGVGDGSGHNGRVIV